MFLAAEVHWVDVQVRTDLELLLQLFRVAEVLRHYDLLFAFCLKPFYLVKYLLDTQITHWFSGTQQIA